MSPPVPTLTLTQTFLNFLDPRRNTIWLLLFVVLMILAIVYGYYNMYVPYVNSTKFGDLSNKKGMSLGQGNGSDVLIYFFHVDWCPHCKTSAPEWKTFSNNYNSTEVNGYVIRCIDIDCTCIDMNDGSCDKSHVLEVKELVQDFEIQGYPTIKMAKEGKTIDFDAKVTNHFLEQFVENMVGPLNSKIDK
jgi:thiol-disulfide isomerase/thioredoxin